MELMNRLILGVVYVTVGIVVGVVAFAAFRFYGGAELGVDGEVAAQGDGREAPTGGSAPGYTRGVHIQQIYSQRAQIVRLQRLLDQKTALLDRKTTLLNEKTAERQTLQTELDNAIALLETLAAEFMLQDATPNRTDQDKDQLKTEVERLRADSNKSRTIDQQQQTELDLLMLELAVTDENITQLEAESEAEVAALLEQKYDVEMIISMAFAQMGEDAVPILVDHLAHQEADIRRWAAVTLGEIGPPARDAIPPLLDALRDGDASVCDAAKAALEKIDRMGQ